jgi:hypothetical protein
VAVAEVARVLEGENLAATVLEDLVPAGEPLQQHGRIGWTAANRYDVFAAPYTLFDTQHRHESLKLLVMDRAEVLQLPNQGMHGGVPEYSYSTTNT